MQRGGHHFLGFPILCKAFLGGFLSFVDAFLWPLSFLGLFRGSYPFVKPFLGGGAYPFLRSFLEGLLLLACTWQASHLSTKRPTAARSLSPEACRDDLVPIGSLRLS